MNQDHLETGKVNPVPKHSSLPSVFEKIKANGDLASQRRKKLKRENKR
jgi:hypothetical protein